MNEQIILLDFGSQYTQVIARRIRECNVYSQILRYDTPAAEIARLKPSGIILSGGPSSVYAKDAPLPDKNIFDLGVPVLGVSILRRTPGSLNRVGKSTRCRSAPSSPSITARSRASPIPTISRPGSRWLNS